MFVMIVGITMGHFYSIGVKELVVTEMWLHK